MTDLCDLCRSPALEQVYQPPGSGRGLTVYLCDHCGLVQSLPRIDRAPRRAAAVSAGADWGNVRYGKGFRTRGLPFDPAHAAPILAGRSACSMSAPTADRFARASRRGADCAAHRRRTRRARRGILRGRRTCRERARPHRRHELSPTRRFDLIHSCHTIEHLKSPREALAEHWRTLKPGGLLIVDVPNIALLGVRRHRRRMVHRQAPLSLLGRHARRACSTRTASKSSTDPIRPIARTCCFAARKRAVAARPIPRADPAKPMRAWSSSTTTSSTRRAQSRGADQGRRRDRLALRTSASCCGAPDGCSTPSCCTAASIPNRSPLLIDTHLKLHLDRASRRAALRARGPAAANAGRHRRDVARVRRRDPQDRARPAPKAEILPYADLLARARGRLAA